MKKALAVIAVVLLLAGAAFASPAELIGTGGLNARFTNFVENALVNPALLGSYVDRAEIGIYTPYFLSSVGAPSLTGLAVIGVGPGILGISAGPRSVCSNDVLSNLPKISSNVTTPNPGTLPTNIVNVGYALDLKGMKAGFSFIYGVNNTSSKNIFNATVDLIDKDESFVSNTLLKLIAGLSLGTNLDVAISFALPNYEALTRDFDTAQGKLESNPQVRYGGMEIGADAKAEVAGLTCVLNATYYTLAYSNIVWFDGNLDGKADTAANGDIYTVNQEDTSALGISLLAAKKAKPTDNLSITVSSGVKVLTTGSGNDITENKVAGTKTINGLQADSGLDVIVPLNLSVDVNLGKFVTWENSKWGLEVGIGKNILILDNYAIKTIIAATQNTDDKTDHSDLTNANPVTGGIGLKWELGDAKAVASAGLALLANGTVANTLGASFIFAWK